MLSFWEKESFLNYDIIIIGSGIVGLSAAISIREKHPDKTVMILERGILPTGASTRNAGFTTFGGVSELLNDLKAMPQEDVFNLVVKRWEGLRMLRERLGDDTIEYKNLGGYEFVFNNESIEKKEVEQINDLLHPLFKAKVFSIDNSVINKFGFNKNFIKHCLVTPFEGQLHTGKMMKALLAMALKLGVEIKTGAEVLKIETTNTAVEVLVSNPMFKNKITFKAEQCIICTNAFTGTFFPDLDITPGRGQVLVTEPIHNLPFKGIFHFDGGFYYFRNIENRILFGGGRNLDFEKEKTTTIALNDTIQEKLDYYLKNLIIPKHPYKVEMRWSGIMAFGKEKTPIVKRIDERIIAGVRMNGIGVALGSMVGKELAGMV
jgi:gamma-glutamylputrescine oxidase